MPFRTLASILSWPKSIASRLSTGSNQGWQIRVQPDSDAAVTVSLPATTNCNATGSVCTADERKLSNQTELTIEGPATEPEALQNTPATGAPSISGTAQVGETLTANTSGIADADELTNVSYSYQWIAGDTNIADATHSTYTLTSGEQGKTIQVRVSFTDDEGNAETLTSAATAQVAAKVAAKPNSPATGAPSISGTAQVGETLAAGTSGIADADELTNVSYSYQWVTDDSDIVGATHSTYTLKDADEGKTVKVRVSFTDDRGNQETLTSSATAAVTGAPADPRSTVVLYSEASLARRRLTERQRV